MVILRVLLCCLVFVIPALGQQQLPPFDADKARAAAQIADAQSATRAYLDSVPVERRQKTKAYAHGNYILDFVDFGFTALILVALLGFGISAKMRDAARRISRFHSLQTVLYWIQFLVLTTLLSFPFTLYRSYFREKAYGLLTQNFGDWMIDQGKGLLVAAVLGAIFFMILYSVLRKAPRTWWLWGSAVMIAFIIFGIAIAPVFIQPLFNKFTPIKDQVLREKILTMAREHAIPADDVYELDASKRTDRISAYVAGLFGTTRIAMYDNTLRRCTPEEIQMIMGHEVGHYVLNHVWKGVAFFSVLVLLGFLVVRWGFDRATFRWPNWRIEGIGDTVGLPLILLLLFAFLFVTQPLTNSWGRTLEAQADDFGLDASHQPDAAATTFLKLGEYRDLEPNPLIETLFYDHPSGRSRIQNAMEWKASHRQ
jgi:Zn-dependent protease with chaperone function